jgi:hypothetical protein
VSILLVTLGLIRLFTMGGGGGGTMGGGGGGGGRLLSSPH